jgi:trans-AT polyketide synthase/acyltransferase/oxidoreductase domain-containing protein
LEKKVAEFEELGSGVVLTEMIRDIRKEFASLLAWKNEGFHKRENVHFVIEKKTEKRKNPDSRNLTEITGKSLGSDEYKEDYNLKYAYATGAMYKGIASRELVVKIGKAGMMGYFGTGGLDMRRIEDAILYIKKELENGQSYGMNLLSNIVNPRVEENTIDLFIKHDVRNIEAAAFTRVTPPLVRYRLKGLRANEKESISILHKIQAKVSRPEVAKVFLSPAPEHIVKQLLKENHITPEEAELSRYVPMADDLCVEADSGGHTDMGVAYSLFPSILRLRDEMMSVYRYKKSIRVGAAGGIGTPEAAAAAFVLGADFILTGSINQCTVEAGTSDAVKDMLQRMEVQDTDYAPAGDMFETGAVIQVLKKGLFFPARARKLYDLYRRFDSLDEIDEATKTQLQEKYFKQSFDDVYKDVVAHYSKVQPSEIDRADGNPKHKMALIFRWYFAHTTKLAISGSEEQKVDYQVHCGPALGAFNQWVKNTCMENWRNRHVDEIGIMLMNETAKLLNSRIQSLYRRIAA